MSEKELYDLALSDVPKYSLLNEILAIRDKRFPDEETDYTINVYGSISLDALNKYVDVVNNWHELKTILKQTKNRQEHILSYGDTNYDLGILAAIEDTLDKMQKLEGDSNE